MHVVRSRCALLYVLHYHLFFLFFFLHIITFVGNVSAGYLHHTLTGANSICSQLIEQFVQQLSTIGHQCAGILMYVTDARVKRSCKGRKAAVTGCILPLIIQWVCKHCQKGTQDLIFLIANALHVSRYCFVLIVVVFFTWHFSWHRLGTQR